METKRKITKKERKGFTKMRKQVYLKLRKKHMQPICHVLKQLQTKKHQTAKKYKKSK